MGFLKLISKKHLFMLYIVIPIIYILFQYLYYTFSAQYAWYQGPVIYVAIYLGYFSLLFKFSFASYTLAIRVSSLSQFYKKAWTSIVIVIAAYVFPVALLLILSGICIGDVWNGQAAILFIIFLFCNMILLGMLYIILSYRWNDMIAKGSLYVLVMIGFGCYSSNEIPGFLNFLNFSASIQWSMELFMRVLGIYGVCLGMIWLISDPRRKWKRE